jgi:predicted PolB exonuclease-like 3'-5' exonuclease
LDLDWVPEDVLEEVLREIEKKERRKLNKKRPTRKDLMRVIKKALAYDVRAQDFVDLVYELLEQEGFETKFTTVKRIWATYEEMVRKGFILDYLDVVKPCRR